jgi:hypothetical protein
MENPFAGFQLIYYETATVQATKKRGAANPKALLYSILSNGMQVHCHLSLQFFSSKIPLQH